MVRFISTATVFTALSTSTSAFVAPSSNKQINSPPAFITRSQSFEPKTSTALEAAPTMVIYWSIKTAFDTLMYSLGQTDEVKGTGVWSAFKLKRDPEEKEEDDDKEGNET